MNERILELAIKARKYAETKPDIYSVAYDKKFAELIIQECAAHLHRRGVEGFGILEERNLKEHFGVES
jgi:hypothetical protein